MITASRCETLLLELSAALDHALDSESEASEVQRHATKFYESLRIALAEQQGKAISLQMRESLFVHKGIPLADVSIRGRATIAFLRFAGAGGLEFSASATQDDVMRLLRLARGVCEGEDWAYGRGQRDILQRMRGARLLEPSDDVTWDWIDSGPAGDAYTRAGIDLESSAPVRRGIAEAIDGAMDLARSGSTVSMDDARGLSEQVLNTSEGNFDNFLQLAERPEFDVFTVQHSLRVTLFATYVASRLGASREALIEIGAAAMLHDVGKGRIPEEVLYKPGRLDEEERRIMTRHPEFGAEILLDSPDTTACVLGAAWGHHLRHDGRGYPERRPWFSRSTATSIVQVCDVFEALTARRPYKAPYSPARAYDILCSDKGAFDPAVLAAFIRSMGYFPPGRFVQLTDGRFARVSASSAVLDRPTVRTVPDGDTLELSHPSNGHLSVLRILDEPEFVEKMIGGGAPEHGISGLSDRDQADQADREREREQAQSRTDELDELLDDPDDVSGHGDDCRLC